MAKKYPEHCITWFSKIHTFIFFEILFTTVVGKNRITIV